MSPTSVKFEIDAMTRRMIFPERVLGMSATTQTCLGRAIFPISDSIIRDTLSATPSASTPGLTAMYISTTCPRTSSTTGIAAASATSSTMRAADSSSLVPRRWPETLITSSTRPRIR